MKSILIFLIIFLSSTAWSQTTKLDGITKINGTNLYIKVTGEGESLLVLHGGPGLNHAYFIPHLGDIEKNFQVIYYDQRACGKSAIPATDSISIKFLVADIEAIRRKLKIEKLNILAHSWGALLAAYYALENPEQVNALIFSNPSMFSREFDKEAAEVVREKTTKEDSTTRARIMSDRNLDSRRYEELFRLSFKASAYNTENISKIRFDLPDNFGTANNSLFTALMKDPTVGANLYDSLPSLERPVLIIHGVADVVPFSSIQRLNEQLPDSKLVIFKESGHFPFVEETRRYNETVIEFLIAHR